MAISKSGVKSEYLCIMPHKSWNKYFSNFISKKKNFHKISNRCKMVEYLLIPTSISLVEEWISLGTKSLPLSWPRKKNLNSITMIFVDCQLFQNDSFDFKKTQSHHYYTKVNVEQIVPLVYFIGDFWLFNKLNNR